MLPRTSGPRENQPYTVYRCERDGYTGPNICIRGINVIIGIVGQIYDNDGRRFDVSRARLLARGSTPYTPVNIAWYRPPPPPFAKEAFENSCERATPGLWVSPVFMQNAISRPRPLCRKSIF